MKHHPEVHNYTLELGIPTLHWRKLPPRVYHHTLGWIFTPSTGMKHHPEVHNYTLEVGIPTIHWCKLPPPSL